MSYKVQKINADKLRQTVTSVKYNLCRTSADTLLRKAGLSLDVAPLMAFPDLPGARNQLKTLVPKTNFPFQ